MTEPDGQDSGASKPRRRGTSTTLPRWRLWLYRLLAITLVPLLFLAVLELGLRVVGFGHPTDFFVDIVGRDADLETTNQKFGWQYFPPAIARTPAPCELPAAKPADTIRIFVLGGSAAMGTPEPAFGLARYLDVMLADAFPNASADASAGARAGASAASDATDAAGVKFEVINAAMTAINSHVVLPIARECADREPDLMIVYMGNNEVVGPYGAGTVFSGFSNDVRVTRATMALKRTKLAQLMAKFRPSSSDSQWRGMEMFLEQTLTADDPRMEDVYAHFRTNLDDICAAATDAGARVLACTVATNLKDCPPFASLPGASVSAADQTRWQTQYDAGVSSVAAGDTAAAVAAFRLALAIDDRRADVHFRLGTAYLALGQGDDAREHFVRARDLDALRFRADTGINRIIRDAAGGRADEGIHLLDVAQAFATDARSPHGLSGAELFYEHVHPNVDGTYLLAKTVFQQVVALVADRVPAAAAAAGGIDPPSQARCLELLPLTAPDRLGLAKAIAKLETRPPFTNQIDHDARVAATKTRMAALEEASSGAAALATARAQYDATLARARPARGAARDIAVVKNHARLLRACGEHKAAADLYRELVQRLPDNASFRNELGLTLQGLGDPDGAITEFEQAMRLDSSNKAGQYSNIGLSYLAKGDATAAEEAFRRALRADPQAVKALNGLGVVLRRQGSRADAIAQFEEALRVDPDDGPSHYNMAVALAEQGDLEGALVHYRRALEDDAGNVDQIHTVASVLARLGQRREAIEYYRRARRFAPQRPDTHTALANALAADGQLAEAVALYREALGIDPGFAEAGHNLAAALGQMGRRDDAIAQYENVLEYSPDAVPTLISLAGILATHEDPRRRDPLRAIRLAQHACELTAFRDAKSLDVLSIAHAAAGHREDARRTAEQALEQARKSRNEALAQRITARLRRLGG